MRSNNSNIDFSILDSLRGLASFYVVINHCRGFMFAGGTLYENRYPMDTWSWWEYIYFAFLQLTSLGLEFVVFFFILSGFSIAHSLHKNPKYWSYLFRRLLRIYPPFVLGLIYAIGVAYLCMTWSPHWFDGNNTYRLFQNLYESRHFLNWDIILGNLCFLPQGIFIGPFWSLSHEILFYITAPLLILFRKSYLLASFIFFVVSVYFFGNMLSPNHFVQATLYNVLYNQVLNYNLYFAIGIFLYFNWQQASVWFICKNKNIIPIVLVVSIVLMSILKYYFSGADNKINTLIAAFLSIFLMVNFTKHDIKIKPLLWLGKISYTMYLVHFPTVILVLLLLYKTGIIDSPEIYNPFIWLIGIVPCVIISYFFYRLAEEPSKKILLKLRNK